MRVEALSRLGLLTTVSHWFSLRPASALTSDGSSVSIWAWAVCDWLITWAKAVRSAWSSATVPPDTLVALTLVSSELTVSVRLFWWSTTALYEAWAVLGLLWAKAYPATP